MRVVMRWRFARRLRAAVICRVVIAPVYANSGALPALAQSSRNRAYIACTATLERIALISENPRVYGIAIRSETNVHAIRVFINTEQRSYAAVITDLTNAKPPGDLRYLTVGDATPIETAWVDRAGRTWVDMRGCSRPVPEETKDAARLKGEEMTTLALVRSFSANADVIVATDVTDLPLAERCFEPTAPPRTIEAAAPQMTVRSTGTVVIRVDLDAESRQKSVTVYRSTVPLLDKSSVDAVRYSTFLTGSVECRPKAASYLYTFDYSRQ